jgi:nucleoside-diphosphate-sugar epimerase
MALCASLTGTAGFIGFHLAKRLLEAGHLVDGYDGMTPYYDPRLKEARRAILLRTNGYRDTVAMLEDMEALPRREQARRTSSSISRRRRGCATRCKIRAPMSTPISSAPST